MILETSLLNHPYNINNEHYKNDLINTIKSLESSLSLKQINHIINHKLQFTRQQLNINQYIQSACELSILSTILKIYPRDFQYEPKLNIESEENKNKDVDFSFYAEGIKINVEVKCFNQQEQNNSNQPSVTFLTPQLPTDFYKNIQEQLPNINFTRSRLLTINDFFDNSIKKFGTKSPQEFNILMICCYDLDDYVDVLESIAGRFGISYNLNKKFLNVKGNIDINNYKNIDAVVVSNLAFNHKESRRDKNFYLNPWNARYSLSIGLQLHEDHEIQKNDLTGYIFKKSFNLHNDGLMSFCKSEEIDSREYTKCIPEYVKYLNSSQEGYYFMGG